MILKLFCFLHLHCLSTNGLTLSRLLKVSLSLTSETCHVLREQKQNASHIFQSENKTHFRKWKRFYGYRYGNGTHFREITSTDTDTKMKHVLKIVPSPKKIRNYIIVPEALVKLIMYSSNSNNLSILRLSPTSYTSSHDLSKTKMVHIGKQKHPVTIMVMAPITAPASQKKSCFETLCTNVYHLSNGGHKMADIINMATNEMPSNSNAAFQDSQCTSDTIKVDILAVANLTPGIILDSSGQDMSLDLSQSLKDHKQDITYIRFRSSVDCYATDNSINTVGSLLDHYSSKLPHTF